MIANKGVLSGAEKTSHEIGLLSERRGYCHDGRKTYIRVTQFALPFGRAISSVFFENLFGSATKLQRKRTKATPLEKVTIYYYRPCYALGISPLTLPCRDSNIIKLQKVSRDLRACNSGDNIL